jgi:hypothetical protein
LDVLPLFGGASDERPRPARDAGGDPADAADAATRQAGERDDHEERGSEPDLVVTGVAAFGGVTVN